jgi:hypothetical protein
LLLGFGSRRSVESGGAPSGQYRQARARRAGNTLCFQDVTTATPEIQNVLRHSCAGAQTSRRAVR